MEMKIREEQHELVYELFKDTQEDDLNYIYRGVFTQNITDSLLALTETNIEKVSEPSKTKRRVYLIMVEGLQNITKHQTKADGKDEKPGFFIIQKKGPMFYVTTANLIGNSKIEALSKHIEKINSLDKKELKNYYKQVLTQGELKADGGAGLGLIDMARKSGHKLYYKFQKIDEQYSFFYLQSLIDNPSFPGTSTVKGYSVDNVSNLHRLLHKINILLVMNSVFTQDSLLSLLTIIENHLSKSLMFRKKVYNIMVEMLQNIIHHASDQDEYEGKPGIFFISEQNNEYLLHSANYIRNKNISKLKGKLDYINSLNREELNDFYNRRLLNFEIDSSKETGLGFIDIRLKSDKKLVFDFKKIDEKSSFFTLQISVLKN